MATASVVVFIFIANRLTGLCTRLFSILKRLERGWMLHTISLKLNKEFRRAYYRGKTYATPLVVVYAFPNRQKLSRLGLTASKKIGKAVQRNRARRLMKEAYRLLEESFPIGYDYVMVARGKIVDASTPQVMKVLRAAPAKLFVKK